MTAFGRRFSRGYIASRQNSHKYFQAPHSSDLSEVLVKLADFRRASRLCQYLNNRRDTGSVTRAKQGSSVGSTIGFGHLPVSLRGAKRRSNLPFPTLEIASGSALAMTVQRKPLSPLATKCFLRTESLRSPWRTIGPQSFHQRDFKFPGVLNARWLQVRP